jgi:hypothetical protein
VNFSIDIPSEIACEAAIESLGWSIGAVAKNLDRGTPAQREASIAKFIALDTMLNDIQAQRRRFYEMRLRDAA